MGRHRRHSESLRVALLSLLFAYAFFFEYLPPFRWASFAYDLPGYHFPLLDYAFRSLREGRLPLWDATMYCGISYVGNVRAGLFYPPNWLLFAANLGRPRMAFWTVEILVVAHVWLAFFLCYLWLRGKRLAAFSSALGAGVFAFSGYLLTMLQNIGTICAYAWMPLGLLAIDQAAETGRWQPLWKLAAASALAFLAGYPPTWFAFCVYAGVYGLSGRRGWKVAAWTALALAFSLLPAMVQALPAWEAAAFKMREPRYGSGFHRLSFYVSYFLPSYWDFTYGGPLLHTDDNYFYLGVPALVGLALAAWRHRLRDLLPALAVLAVSIVVAGNPFGLVYRWMSPIAILTELCRDFYFLAGITLAVAPIAATGLDSFLQSGPPATRRRLVPVLTAALGVWALAEMWLWRSGGAAFALGWRSALYPAVLSALFACGLYLLRSPQGRGRTWLAAALLLAVGADYKAFGTSRRFNSTPQDYDRDSFNEPFNGLDDAVYRRVLAQPGYRVAVDPIGPFTDAFRHHGLATPQGCDPMLPGQYHEKLRALVRPGDARLFDLDPSDPALLRSLGVRYFLTAEQGRFYPVLKSSPDYRLEEPSTSYYKVFELRDALPAYRLEPPAGTGPSSIERVNWKPEHREFVVRSAQGRRFVLVEQFHPGWRAAVDGQPVPIERCEGAFQAIAVPAGEHRVRFDYWPRTLLPGALLSLAGVAFLFVVARGGKGPGATAARPRG